MQSDLTHKVDRIAGQMQSRGMSDPLIAAEQLAHLIYLKILDEESSITDASDAERSKFDLKDVFPLQAKRFRWEYWKDKSGNQLVEFVREEVFYYLSTVVREEPQAASYFRSARLEIEDPELFEMLIAELDSIEFSNLDPSVSGTFLECLLTHLGAHDSSESEFSLAPQALIELLVELAEPTPRESIFDPACQTAQLLAGAIRHVDSRFGRLISSQLLAGMERSRTMLHIATVNVMLSGIRYPNLKRARQLSVQDPSDEGESLSKYDIVLTRLPLQPRQRLVGSLFPSPRVSMHADIHSLNVLIESLNPGGKCVSIVPNQLLGSGPQALRNMRKRLVQECEIQAVVSLPVDTAGRRRTNYSILMFRRPEHPRTGAAIKSSTDHVWFYQLHHFNETKAMISTWSTYKSSSFRNPPGPNGDKILEADVGEPKYWWISYESLEENGFSLEASDYKPFVWNNLHEENPIDLVESAIQTELNIELELRNLLNKLKSML